MFESWSAHFNEVKEAVERFERMENIGKEYFFDVHTIEGIFDFYIDKLHFDKAERIIDIGIRQHPSATTLQVKRAILYIEKDQIEEATGLLENLLFIEKSNSEVYLNLGYAYFCNGQNLKAIKTFEEGLKFAFNDEEELLLDVVLYLNQFREFQSVIDVLMPRYETIKEHENLMFELAYAFDKVRKDEMALQIYNELLDLNPFSDNAWYNLGISRVKLGAREEAIEAFDFCLTINPYHTQAYFNKGNSLAQLKRLPEALDSYFECISFEVSQPRCLHYIADCWAELGNTGYAQKYFELALTIDPLDFEIWEGYARFLLDSEEPAKCRETIDHAMKKMEILSDNELGTFYHLKAQTYIYDEHWDLSRYFFKKAALNNRRDFSHVASLYKLNKALNPDYNIELFIEEYTSDFLETAAFQYMLSAYHLLITEKTDTGLMHLEEAIYCSPGFLDEFSETFPDVLEIAAKNDKLAQIIKNGIHEL